MLQLGVKVEIGDEKELLVAKVGNGEVPLPLLPSLAYYRILVCDPCITAGDTLLFWAGDRHRQWAPIV
jgi:hypothetical protein